jgi:hypothetical protein
VSGEREPIEGDGDGDERITLPHGACCLLCDFSRLTPSDPNTLQRTRICKRFPPAVVMVPVQSQAGVGMGLMSANRPVNDADVCYEYQEREGAEIVPLSFGGTA